MTHAPTSETAGTALPEDLAGCHAFIEELLATRQEQEQEKAQLDEKEALIEELMATITQQEREKAQLLHRVRQLLDRIYGRRSEKIDPAQLLLALGEIQEVIEAETPPEETVEEEPKPKKKGHGRKKPPAELPHIPLEHEVPEAEKTCTECGGAKKRIGQKVTEQLEYAPASLFVIDHIQPVYACPCCQEGVTVAPKPAQPIEKGLPGPGLLATVAVNKYGDHLPLYRQEHIFARHGVEISRKTMCDWILASAHILEPVLARMTECVLESKVIHTDDTPVKVRCRGVQYEGRFWVYLGDADHPYTVFDFTPDRKRDGPVTFLEVFTGSETLPRYLQADAYGGYDGIFTADTGVLECACWAHARRKYHEARKTDVMRAHQMLAWIKDLYKIERDAKMLGAALRHAMRQERAKPILEKIETWLEEQGGHVLPKSPIGAAVTYMQNQWDALKRYLDDGDLAIDNNAAENALRGIAIGRKNYLFIGSERGGRAAATLYSLIKSAQRHAIDPFIYLRDLFCRIPTHPNRALDQLLPDNWKRDILPTLDIKPPRL